MRKTVYAIIAVLMLAFCLTACSGENEVDALVSENEGQTAADGASIPTMKPEIVEPGKSDRTTEQEALNNEQTVSNESEKDPAGDQQTADIQENEEEKTADLQDTDTETVEALAAEPAAEQYSDMPEGIYDPESLMLFSTDVRGKAIAGQYAPCYAYSLTKADISDIKDSGLDTESLGDTYDLYKIVFKEGLKFTGGVPITTDDVLYSLSQACSSSGEDDKLTQAGILGLRAYSLGIEDYYYELFNKVVPAGLNEDDSYPAIEGVTPEESALVWELLPEAGKRFAQQIVDYVYTHYKEDQWVQAFFSSKINYKTLTENESFRIAYAYILWGYASETWSFNASNHNFSDLYGNDYNLDSGNLKVENFWKVIFNKYGWDTSQATGINYEKPKSAEYTIEDLLWNVYYEKYSSDIKTIPGILKGTTLCEDGRVRSCLYVLMKKGGNIADMNFEIWNKRGVG